jgi:hypothetical protein
MVAIYFFLDCAGLYYTLVTGTVGNATRIRGSPYAPPLARAAVAAPAGAGGGGGN